MKRNNLTTAVLAGLAGAAGIVGSAQAVNLNPDGLGQVLIYPYYTSNGGNQTILSVVNTTGEAKAVKVRFREGQNSRDVLDFNLYLSAYDVWVAAVADATYTEDDALKSGFDSLAEMTADSEPPGEGGFGADHGPVLFIPDASCTVPYLYAEGGRQPFLNFGYADAGADADKGATNISRAAEGHFAIIEMGTLVDVAVLVDDDEDPETPDIDIGYYSATAATHTDGVPNDCQQLVDAWTIFDTLDPDEDGYWVAREVDGSESIDISHPSGGLFGGAAIVNADNGTMYSYDARAINGFIDDEIHTSPGGEEPNLNSGDRYDGNAFSDSSGFPITWDFEGNGETVDAVSYVFMHDAIMNEYNTQDSLNAASEWVITFPTKIFYTFRPFADEHVDWNETDDNVDPFISLWSDNWHGTSVADPADDIWAVDDEGEDYIYRHVNDGACEPVRLDTIWDREEDFPTAPDPVGGTIPPIVSPAPPEEVIPLDPSVPFELCYETQVLRFGEDPGSTTEILGSSNFTNVDNDALGYDNGWARIDFVNYDADIAPVDGVFDTILQRDPLGNLLGLPVTGFWVERFENGFIDDGEGGTVAGNYGGIFDHKGTRLEVLID